MIAPLLLLIAFTFTLADAAAVEQADTGSTPATSPPDAELLEFIAGFEPVDDTWIDPMHYYDTYLADDSTKENDHE